MRGVDYDATHLVKAVKGLDLHPNAYTPVEIKGKNVKITEGNKDTAMQWFAEWAAPIIDVIDDNQKVLIPIPAGDVVEDSPDDFRTTKIAREISSFCGSKTVVAPILRWNEPMTPSRKGGPRDARVLYSHLIQNGEIPQGTVVLIYDVFTFGGHFISAAWKLDDSDRSVALAVCCGHTEHHQLDDPFSVPDELLDISR